MHNDFFQWLDTWTANLPEKKLTQLGKPHQIALVSVDMIVGFCHTGPLASEKVHDIIPDVVAVFTKAHQQKIEHFLLLQDTHTENAEEFGAYPPHCIKGTEESENIPELATLPFANKFITFEKNALSPAYDTTFDEWIKKHPEVDTFILIGDCTDLCIYSVAMHLRMSANAKNIKRKIIVPANAVATYDMSIQTAQKIGALPHPADLIHPFFLYHLALNGVEVVQSIS
jgi:nicotinamidase-related amidase